MPKKNLFLLRHAKSDWDIEVIDFFRPLKKRGVRNAKRMGTWMLDQTLIPEMILSSPAERAIDTAKKICKVMGLDKSLLQTDERIYNASAELLQTVIRECPGTVNTLLVVGHNPGLEDLLVNLVNSPFNIPDDGKILPTTALAQLEISSSWSKLVNHRAILKGLTRVKELPEAI